MMPGRVRLAVLIAVLGHGLFILTARYHLSYDAYTHMFFADHYARDWWSLWEPRWFGGFEVVSYPPLVHQTIGLLSHLIGVDASYALVAWGVLSVYPVGVYAFSRIFCGRTASAYAALGAALLPSIYYSTHTFGQLPTLTATLFALFGLAALAEYLRSGKRLSGALAVSLMTVTIASHHATLLFLPWAIAAVGLHILLNQRPDKSALISRLLFFGSFSTIGVLLVIWPFWAWGMDQTIQTPIDHASRHNFFIDHFAFNAFFLPMYGPLIVFIPFAVWFGRQRHFISLFLSFSILFLLGLGGTTPLPRWLFGSGWAWLTYDRFALWASLVLLPFFAIALIKTRGHILRWLTFRTKTELISSRFSIPLINLQGTWKPRRWVNWITFGIFALVALIAGFIPDLIQTQPKPVNMQPIVDFLAAEHRSDWRYLTFGFGDQLAYLSRLTEATTLDGTYFTARSLPELRTSGIGQIDSVLWSIKGLRALDPILEESGVHGVRWGFVNNRKYIPAMLGNGWIFVQSLPNGISVWENPRAVLPTPYQPPADRLASFSWGTLPLLALSVTTALAGLRLRPVPTHNLLLGSQFIATGLLPISLLFWYFHRLTDNQHPLVYFSYDNALFFISDALALIAVLSWSIPRVFGSSHLSSETLTKQRLSFQRLFLSVNGLFFGLCLLASLSILWSWDWRISLYVSVHLWLVYSLFLSVQDRPELWRAFAIGAFTALTLQVSFGIWQFIDQSTAFMTPLNLEWLPALEPAMKGVSVVQLMDGTRLMRVYGSLPHPNILAGMILVFLPGLSLLYMKSARRNIWLLILFCLSFTLLALTFSRAAWIGAVIAVAVLTFRRHFLDRKRLLALASAGLIGVLAVLIPLHEYVFIRVANAPVPTERGSWEVRLWLAERAWLVIRQHPWLGVGIGSYTVASAGGLSPEILGVPEDFHLEPVHSVPLLILGELGLGGLILAIGLGMRILWSGLRARGSEMVFISSTLIGLCVVQFFDHFLWTLAPGRILFGLILGLWAGLAKQDERDQAIAAD